jgi:hypothetical protein
LPEAQNCGIIITGVTENKNKYMFQENRLVSKFGKRPEGFINKKGSVERKAFDPKMTQKERKENMAKSVVYESVDAIEAGTKYMKQCGFTEEEAKRILEDPDNPFVADFLDFMQKMAAEGKKLNKKFSDKRMILFEGVVVPVNVHRAFTWHIVYPKLLKRLGKWYDADLLKDAAPAALREYERLAFNLRVYGHPRGQEEKWAKYELDLFAKGLSAKEIMRMEAEERGREKTKADLTQKAREAVKSMAKLQLPEEGELKGEFDEAMAEWDSLSEEEQEARVEEGERAEREREERRDAIREARREVFAEEDAEYDALIERVPGDNEEAIEYIRNMDPDEFDDFKYEFENLADSVATKSPEMAGLHGDIMNLFSEVEDLLANGYSHDEVMAHIMESGILDSFDGLEGGGYEADAALDMYDDIMEAMFEMAMHYYGVTSED